MDTPTPISNRVRPHRQGRGWSQVELAGRAGISRAAVSAIEVGRLVPSVAAALGLAAAFGCTVEDLFGRPDGDPGPTWAWPPPSSPCRYWLARVRGRMIAYPVEPTPAGVVRHDGVFRDGAFVPADSSTEPDASLVVAGCDPAAGLLAAQFARSSGFRLLVLARSSREALALLGRGVVHAAGVHFATPDDPDANVRAVGESLGQGQQLLRVARWQEGLAVGTGTKARSVTGAVRGGGRWAGREQGSAARRCQDELLGSRPSPRRVVRDHRGVAEAVRAGWADLGVCHRLAAEDAGVRFLEVRVEGYDLCYPVGGEGDHRMNALVQVVRSAAYRRLLGDVSGYDTSEAGDVRPVR